MTDINSQTLHVVAKELAATLNEARAALETYAERPEQIELLQKCGEQLHQAHGVLRLVEVYGAALLAEEMEQVTAHLLDVDGEKKHQAEGLDALMRAMVQLPTYLERVLSGGRDLALILLPLLNDLRAVRGSPLLSEGTLLLLNLKSDQPAQPQAARPGEPPLSITQWARRLRTRFQLGLLGLIRGERVEQNLEIMAKVAEKFEQVATTQPVFQLWWVTGALLEALRANGLESSATLKRLLGQADRQIKRLYEIGEARYCESPPVDLLNNMLYYVARASTSGGRIGAVRASFKLVDLLPVDADIEQERESLSAPSVKLMHTVADAIKEDLSKVKDVLDIFVRRGGGQLEELTPQLDLLKKISETLGVLGLGELRQRVQGETQELSASIGQGQTPSEDALLKMAATLLAVEDSLDDQLVRLILPSAAPDGGAQPGDDMDFRSVTEAVLRECIVNLARVKEAVSIAVNRPGDSLQQGLDNVPQLLRGITAGLLMLGKGRAVELMDAIGAHVRALVEPGAPPPDAARLERIADAIVSVEYYMETLQSGRSDPWYMLDNAETCIKALQELATRVPIIEAPAVVDVTRTMKIDPLPQPAAPGAAGARVGAWVAAPAGAGAVAGAGAAGVQTAGSARPLDAHGATQPSIAPSPATAEYIDPEFLELFIEEAKEEIASIQNIFPLWDQNPMDTDSLNTLRRSFHTLKGSGRMVGARLIGEFGWSVENLLNRLIDKTLTRTPGIMAMMRNAVAALPALVEQLETGRPMATPVEPIMARAYAYADGRDPDQAVAQLAAERPAGPAAAGAGLAVPVFAAPAPAGSAAAHAAPRAADLETSQAASSEYVAPAPEIAAREPAAPEMAAAALHVDGPDAAGESSLDADVHEAGVRHSVAAELSSASDFADNDGVVPARDEGAVPASWEDAVPASAEDAVLADGDDAAEGYLDAAHPDAAAADGDGVAVADGAADADGVVAVDDAAFVHGALNEDVAAGVESEAVAFEGAPPASEQPELAASEAVVSEDVKGPPLMDPVLHDIYSKETEGHLLVIREYLRKRMGQPPPHDLPESVYRAVHTLSGSSKMAEARHGIRITEPLNHFMRKVYDSGRGLSEAGLMALNDSVAAIDNVVAHINEATAFFSEQPPLVHRFQVLEAELDAELAREALAEHSAGQISAEGILAEEMAADVPAADLEAADLGADAPTAGLGTADAPPAEPDYAEQVHGALDFELFAEPELGPEAHGEPAAAYEESQGEIHSQPASEAEPESESPAALESELWREPESRLEPQTRAEPESQLEPHARTEPESEPESELRPDRGPELWREPAAPLAPAPTHAPAAEAEAAANEEFDAEIAGIYSEEAAELLEAAEVSLSGWNRDRNDRSKVAELQRQLHTLKGGARMAGITAMGNLSHELESLVGGIDAGLVAPDDRALEVLQASLDELARMRDMLSAGQRVPAAAGLISRIRILTGAETPAAAEAAPIARTAPTAGTEGAAGMGRAAGTEGAAGTEAAAGTEGAYGTEAAAGREGTTGLGVHTPDGAGSDAAGPAVTSLPFGEPAVVGLVAEGAGVTGSAAEAPAVAASAAEAAAVSGSAVEAPAVGGSAAAWAVAGSAGAASDLAGVNAAATAAASEAAAGSADAAPPRADEALSTGSTAEDWGVAAARPPAGTGQRPASEIASESGIAPARESSGEAGVGGSEWRVAASSAEARGVEAREASGAEARGAEAREASGAEARGAEAREAGEDSVRLPLEQSGVATLPVLPGREAVQPERAEMARVDADLLDTMLNNAGEVSIFRARLDQQVSSIDFNLAELARTVTRLKEQLRGLEIETEAQVLNRHDDISPRHADFDPLELDRYSTLQQFSRALAETSSDVASIQGLLEALTREAQNLLTQQSRVITELQNGLMRTRMVPFQRHVQRLSRLVRQAANDTHKRAELAVEGAAAELDRQVLERMVPPLEHLLRNAVVHGIETPERRVAAGKPEVGRISVSIERDGAEVVIVVADDGNGINVKLIREKALSLGLADPNHKLTDEEAMQLILEPGFSTAGRVTQAAGRGVGMDVVATEVKKLGGGLFIESTPGRGSRFTIRLPFTLAISQALIVRVAEEVYALPLATVEGVVRLPKTIVARHLGKDAPLFEYGAQRYRFQQLGSFVGLGPTPLPEADVSMSVVLIRAGEHSTALVTDELVGSREIVVKSLGPQISAIRGIAGATILGDGRIVVILDMGALVRSEWRAKAVETAVLSHRDRRTFALVVDDSITVRRVTQRLLERNGMRVITAKDGVDAVSVLQEHLPDVILLDIEMPRMDGYEVAAHVRNDPRLKDIPIVMITSRVSEKHRARAIEIGVDDYLGKPYQENQLLDAIEPLVHRRRAVAERG